MILARRNRKNDFKLIYISALFSLIFDLNMNKKLINNIFIVGVKLSCMFVNVTGEEKGEREFPRIGEYQVRYGKKQKYTKQIVFNLADTQYDVIERVGNELGWKLQYNDSKNWDIKWNDSSISVQILSKMQTHQKTNHFPGMNTLHRKNNLAKNLYRLLDQEPN